MQDQKQRLRTFRITMGIMASGLLIWAAKIAWTQRVTISGKARVTTYVGAQALPWAGLAACFGVALLGVMFRNAALMAGWMGVWLLAGVAIVLAPAFLT